MKKLWLLIVLFMAAEAQAYNGLSSELSHAAGGALAAGATTWVFRDSENRAWIGFAASTALAIYQQGGQIRRGGPKHEQYMDIFSHMAGAAIGAWGTDKYLLLPVIGPDHVGLVYHREF